MKHQNVQYGCLRSSESGSTGCTFSVSASDRFSYELTDMTEGVLAVEPPVIVSKEMIINVDKIPESPTMLKDEAEGLLLAIKGCLEHSVVLEVCARLRGRTVVVTGSVGEIFLEP